MLTTNFTDIDFNNQPISANNLNQILRALSEININGATEEEINSLSTTVDSLTTIVENLPVVTVYKFIPLQHCKEYIRGYYNYMYVNIKIPDYNPDNCVILFERDYRNNSGSSSICGMFDSQAVPLRLLVPVDVEPEYTAVDNNNVPILMNGCITKEGVFSATYYDNVTSRIIVIKSSSI